MFIMLAENKMIITHLADQKVLKTNNPTATLFYDRNLDDNGVEKKTFLIQTAYLFPTRLLRYTNIIIIVTTEISLYNLIDYSGSDKLM